MMIAAWYIAFTLLTVGAFFVLPLRQAAFAAFMAGWLVLPVAEFPASVITREIFTVEVIGAALPSNIGLTKAVVIPLAVLLGMLIRAPEIFRSLRLWWMDFAVLLLVLWPLLLGITGTETFASAAIKAGYMAAAWGGSWLIGRILAASDNGQRELVEAIGWSGIPLLPISMYEGMFPPAFYSTLYGYHPFQLEGADRYIGYRPMGLLEHGNQFGIWIAMSALAWFAMAKRTQSKKSLYVPLAVITALATLASQSVGAIALYFAGLLWIILPRRALGLVAATAALFTVLFSGIYLSGKLPVARTAWEQVAGGKLTGVLRATGRASLGYRVRRDQMALELIRKAPLAGYGTWDWWRPLGSHPWGLQLLLAGQFGIMALLFSTVTMLGGAVRSIWRRSHSVLPIIVILGVVDAWLNSYIFWPGLVAAGALSSQLGSGPTARRSASRSRSGDTRGDGRSGDVARAPSMTRAG
jgi:hypothetical protein